LKWPPISFFEISASTEWANRQFHISRSRTVKEVNIHFGIRWILKIQIALGLRIQTPQIWSCFESIKKAIKSIKIFESKVPPNHFQKRYMVQR
jgi:hypothetical protein